MMSPGYPARSFSLAEAPPAGGAAPLTPLPVSHNDVPWRFPSLTWQAYPSTVANPVYYV